jgi:hypothetical protein
LILLVGVCARSLSKAGGIHWALLSVFSLLIGEPAAAQGDSPPPPFSTSTERCILPAAQFHGVNPFVLRAILKVESNLNPGAVGKNDNQSVDVGIGQMNSTHFKELAKYGIGPDQLKDACVGTYVAAWHLKKGIAAHGNTWEAIARYHSSTPYFNKRYQILLSNELVRSKVLVGVIQPVPPLRPRDFASSNGAFAQKMYPAESGSENSTVVVLDESQAH